jgi:hypothetical protein
MGVMGNNPRITALLAKNLIHLLSLEYSPFLAPPFRKGVVAISSRQITPISYFTSLHLKICIVKKKNHQIKKKSALLVDYRSETLIDEDRT